jgi:serine/threonine protein kinase
MSDEKTSRPKTTHSVPSDAGSAAAPTDVRLADESVQASDVKLAESLSPSDVVLAESGTGAAPSFRAPATPPPSPSSSLAPTVELKPDADRKPRDKAPMALLPGAKVDDFEIIKLLGRGAFGHVYLARQVSLDRQVALKISANRGSEGRTMARLEHQHIVQVFSETVDRDFNQRLLCMQLVPGIGLDKLINMLNALSRGKETDAAAPNTPRWMGADILAFIDHSGSLPTALDTSALHDREALGKMDDVEATAWFGTRLAEALDFAHRHGVLHRDIKPANILVNPYGRPMLADFNISSQPIGSESSGDELFGGTFAYMSPEHLDAFNPNDPTEHEAVTARSDLYSLGIVLQQLLDGRVGIPQIERKPKLADTLRAIADDRRRGAPVCKPGLPGARMTLERSLGRCLEPLPEDRFENGADLAAQLDGCRHLREAERRLPKVPPMFAPILRHPFLWLVLLVILPQMAGSVVNITYNMTQIVDELRPEQKEQFMRLVGWYNAIVYPVAIIVFIVVVHRAWRTWRALQNADRIPDGEVQLARRRALRLPRFIASLTAFGWFPGAVLFPLLLTLTVPPISAKVDAHFLVSFCLSGLIALAYSLCGVEFIVLRGLYPGLWRDAQNFTEAARRELAPVGAQLYVIQALALLIPLLAAIVTIILTNTSSPIFQAMAVALILLGCIGFFVTSAITNHLSRVLVAITNTKD